MRHTVEVLNREGGLNSHTLDSGGGKGAAAARTADADPLRVVRLLGFFDLRFRVSELN